MRITAIALLFASCVSAPMAPKVLPEYQRSQFMLGCLQQLPITVCLCIEDQKLSAPSVAGQVIIQKCVQDFIADNPDLVKEPADKGIPL